MKIGFSSSLCPDWDLGTLISIAKELGCDAVELSGPKGQSHLPCSPAVGSDPGRVGSAFREAGLELLCIGTDCSLQWADRRTREDHKTRILESVEFAARAGAGFVRINTGNAPAFAARDAILVRTASALREIAPHAAEHRVTLLVENTGNLASSRDMWFILDAAGHPAVRCCWNPCNALLAGDSLGLAVPRVGRSITMTHLVDARFGADIDIQYQPLGQGQCDLSRYLTLLLGLGSDSYLIADQPAAGLAQPDAKAALAASVSWMREELTRFGKTPELSAYKGDKNAPHYATSPRRATANG